MLVNNPPGVTRQVEAADSQARVIWTLIKTSLVMLPIVGKEKEKKTVGKDFYLNSFVL